MDRRCFVQGALVTSASAVAGLAVTPLVKAQEKQEPTRLRATVLRVTLDEKLDRELRGGKGGRCPVFQEGQEFVIDSPYLCPEGFCHWAWGRHPAVYSDGVLRQQYATSVVLYRWYPPGLLQARENGPKRTARAGARGVGG